MYLVCTYTSIQNHGTKKENPVGGTGVSFLPGYSATNNHYTDGATYDANGNLTNDGTDHVYSWDADGHPVTLDTLNLIYDALGREVELQNGGANTEFVFGPTGKLAIMNGQTQTKAFVPLPGGTQVKYAAGVISSYRLPDWLGSFRVGSNPNRTYSWGIAFAPFGEQYAQSGSPALSFTGEEGTADTVSDEFDFLARKLHSAQGRWLSPDPAGPSAADPSNPQSWNRYGYVLNNPLSMIDPAGLDPCADGSESPQGVPCFTQVTASAPQVPSLTIDVMDTLGEIAMPGFDLARVLHFQIGRLKWPKQRNPANNGTTPSPYSTGCIVAATCGPTANTHGMSHCTVTVGQNGKYTAYDGGPTGSVWNSTLQVQSGPGGPPGPNTFYMSDSCSMAGCVPRVAQNINNANMWYSFPFQNSNTAAGMMLNQCGANVTLPVWGPQ